MKIPGSFLAWLFLMFSGGTAHAMFTFVHICHDGGPPLRLAVYNTYQGIFSDYSVSGWYRLENRDCVSETLAARSVRAYAFATFDDQNRLVPLEYDVRAGRRNFGRSTSSICVPVAETPEPFVFKTPQQQGSAPPCQNGHVAIPVSLNIRAGGRDEEFRFYFRLPADGLPPPHPDYARIMADRLPPKEPEPEAAPAAPVFLTEQNMVEELGENAARITRYCRSLAYPMDVWNGSARDKTDFCPVWMEWEDASDAHQAYRPAINVYRHQCTRPGVVAARMPYDPVDIVIRWPLIVVHALRGDSFHRYRCTRMRDMLQEAMGGHLEKSPTSLARTVHDRLFVQDGLRHFR